MQTENRALRLKEMPAPSTQQQLLVVQYPQEGNQQMSFKHLQLQSHSQQQTLSSQQSAIVAVMPAVAAPNFFTNDEPSLLGSSWRYFDEKNYVLGGSLHMGEDPYKRNRFNQQASDALPSNREIPDTRNAM